jgi:predicted phage baseplate assembly protein
VEILQPFAAIGGYEAEPLDRTHGRALDRLASATRGVTTDDLEQLAREAPGTPVKRAIALPDRHPAFPCLPAPGVVTVVLLPPCGDRPVPSVAMLREVAGYLERRRPLTTELHVVGPEYVGVEVSATLHVAHTATDVSEAARAALDRFFHPLWGGQDETGWPLGRDVLESEVLAVLASVPGVVFADGLTIGVRLEDESSEGGRTPVAAGRSRSPCGCQAGSKAGGADPKQASQGFTCGNLALCGIQLVDSRTHRLRVVKE